MKIVIMGSGGVGGYFGARLADAGEDVSFVARGSHLEAIKKNENIHVEVLGGEPNARIPGLEGPRAKCTKEGIIDADVIMVPLSLIHISEPTRPY